MEGTEKGNGVLHDAVERTDPEDLRREPDTSSIRGTPGVLPDDSTVPVRGRCEQEDVSVVERTAEIIDPFGRILGATSYRVFVNGEPVKEMVKSNGQWTEQTRTE